jgi:exonuclease III
MRFEKKMSYLKVCSLNINNIAYKSEEIAEFLDKESPDCLLIQEIRKEYQKNINIKGYRSFEQLGDSLKGRVGLMGFYKENIRAVNINQSTYDNMLKFSVQLAYGLKISIVNVYNRNISEDRKYN